MTSAKPESTTADESRPVALVTGAARGIGAACARALNEAGYRIALHYRSNPDAAEAFARDLEGAETFQADLSDEAACASLVKTVGRQMGRLDVLVNNAGVAIDQILPFAKPADFDTLIATNLKPVFALSKAASRLMIKAKRGAIINMTSVVGHSGNGGQSMYAATKGGVTSFTKSIALELAGHGIRANCVAPGFIATDMTDALGDEVREGILERVPLKRLGEPKEVAAAVAFLASPAASYITGTTLHVNGGMYCS